MYRIRHEFQYKENNWEDIKSIFYFEYGKREFGEIVPSPISTISRIYTDFFTDDLFDAVIGEFGTNARVFYITKVSKNFNKTTIESFIREIITYYFVNTEETPIIAVRLPIDDNKNINIFKSTKFVSVNDRCGLENSEVMVYTGTANGAIIANKMHELAAI